jgi:hypothetical protein
MPVDYKKEAELGLYPENHFGIRKAENDFIG